MNRISIVKLALTQLGKPYLFGADAVNNIKLDDKNPLAFDCSFFTEWCYWNAAKLTLPRHSGDQFLFCKETDNPLPGDLGFFADDKNVIFHVGLVVNDTKVIEARGHQDHTSFETGKVILRPLIIWNGYKSQDGHHFAGWRVHPELSQ